MPSIQDKYENLIAKIAEIKDIESAASLLHWDQEIYMPPNAAAGRGQQLATLSALAHRMFVDEETGALLHNLRESKDNLNADQMKLVDETLYDYEQATKLPEKFVHEYSLAQSQAYQAWVESRQKKDFRIFEPLLEKIVLLNIEKADYKGYEESPYDALLEEFERGMTTREIQSVFDGLKDKQSVLLDAIINSPNQPDTSWLENKWDEDRQWGITLKVLEDMGYDFQSGRQDKSVHPFTTNFDLYDVRITTRISPDELFSGLTGSMHEGGHALYEQGLRAEDNRTTLADAISLGIHESQSRLWENVIGRSWPFWQRYGSLLRENHAPKLNGVSNEQFYRAINKVERTFIRVEADECSYNLHIILRFEIERDLIEGKINVKDIPAAWNEKFEQLLGLKVPSDDLGCLQDIHWARGAMGYFPTYALGNLYAAQFFNAMENDLPKLWGDVENGDFTHILTWLREKIHRVGRRQTAPELVRQVSGKPLTPKPFLDYLQQKYSEIYQLDLPSLA